MKIKQIFLTLAVTGCMTLSAFAQHSSKPFILGRVDTVESKVLSEKRIINIYLPEGYSPDSARTYPVIYLLDGSADEDFIHIAGIVQYLNFPWIDKIPPSIVVGIANVNRKRDFTFPVKDKSFIKETGFDPAPFSVSGGSEKFMDFISGELQPFMKKNYKASDGATLLGQSLGGLLASEILLKRPSMFDTYIIISPSLWWDRESLLSSTPGAEDLKDRKIYISAGADEPKMMQEDARRLSQLLEKSATRNTLVVFELLPDEDHATIMHQAAYNGFRKLNGKKKK